MGRVSQNIRQKTRPDPVGSFSSGSFHGKDLAIDVAGKRFNKLTDEQARVAALNAGFTHGVYEDFKGTNRDHWHFQIGAGNGLSDKHKLSNKPLTVKSY